MDLNKFAAEVHQNAVEHGFWDNPVSFGETVALCHSELSEALEEYRKGNSMEYVNDFSREKRITDPAEFGDRKPEGIAVEMADTIIRILDWCGAKGIDIEGVLERKHAYNRTRSYRHGGKKL